MSTCVAFFRNSFLEKCAGIETTSPSILEAGSMCFTVSSGELQQLYGLRYCIRGILTGLRRYKNLQDKL